MRRLAGLTLVAAAMVGGPVQSAAREPRFVVLPVAEVERAYAHVPSLGDPYWRPTADEVNLARRGLAAYLRRSGVEGAPAIADKLGGYALQFAGVEGPDGRPLMVINAFCHPENHPDWRTTWVGVDDGGDCYFEAYWERDTRRFRGVSINGIA